MIIIITVIIIIIIIIIIIEQQVWDSLIKGSCKSPLIVGA